jgi:hypothetical protein
VAFGVGGSARVHAVTLAKIIPDADDSEKADYSDEQKKENPPPLGHSRPSRKSGHAKLIPSHKLAATKIVAFARLHPRCHRPA